MDETIRNEILALRQTAGVAYVTSVDGQGYPQVKAMLVLEHTSAVTQFFSTNTSSRRVGQFQANPKASVYYCDPARFMGALFTGRMRVRADAQARRGLWREGFECYYPKGVDDEDYSVLEFTAETVNYYHGLHNATFAITELEAAQAEGEKRG